MSASISETVSTAGSGLRVGSNEAVSGQQLMQQLQ